MTGFPNVISNTASGATDLWTRYIVSWVSPRLRQNQQIRDLQFQMLQYPNHPPVDSGASRGAPLVSVRYHLRETSETVVSDVAPLPGRLCMLVR